MRLKCPGGHRIDNLVNSNINISSTALTSHLGAKPWTCINVLWPWNYTNCHSNLGTQRRRQWPNDLVSRLVINAHPRGAITISSAVIFHNSVIPGPSHWQVRLTPVRWSLVPSSTTSDDCCIRWGGGRGGGWGGRALWSRPRPRSWSISTAMRIIVWPTSGWHAIIVVMWAIDYADAGRWLGVILTIATHYCGINKRLQRAWFDCGMI